VIRCVTATMSASLQATWLLIVGGRPVRPGHGSGGNGIRPGETLIFVVDAVAVS
jgi:hypothetical protein